MEDQAAQAMARLQAVQLKVKQVQDKLETRLPAQRSHLSALVCGTKWRLQTQTALADDAVQAAAKRVRMELGAFDYQAKEQAELLTRYLIELDDILSFGNADVKNTRKALVVEIQGLFPTADAMKAQSANLKQLGERLLESFLPPLTPPATPAPERATESEESENVEEETQPAVDASSQDAPAPVNTNDEEMEAEEDEADEADESDEDDEDMENDENEEEEEEEEEQQRVRPQPAQMRYRTAPIPTTHGLDISSLPVWKPYYQLQRRPDGIYLIAKLRDIDQRNVRVQWAEQSGVLRISGFKLPTQKDLMLSRFSGAPTFGRFDITERFPRNVVNMDEATQHLHEDGTLEIRMPYYYVQYPHRMQRSWVQPRDCFVW